MNAEAFMELVKNQGGFEFVIGFPEDVDHYIGGQGNKYWYLISRGKKQEYYVGTYANGAWSDKFYTKKGDTLSEKSVASGTTIAKIVERAYYYQEKTVNRKPSEVEKNGYACYHYSFGFGESACDISKDYGVTIGFNDINKSETAYHLRDITVGSEVEKPREN